MTDIPERLRERAKTIELAFFKPDRIEHPEKRPSLVDLIALALHEIEQAAERRGIERAAKLCDKAAEHDPVLWRSAYNHAAELLAADIRALATTAEPAKGA